MCRGNRRAQWEWATENEACASYRSQNVANPPLFLKLIMGGDVSWYVSTTSKMAFVLRLFGAYVIVKRSLTVFIVEQK